MFKVLFADDEPRMLRALEKMIDWHELGLEIVGCAGDGIEALELIHEKKPDIVITDIRIPGRGYGDIHRCEKAVDGGAE